VYSLQFVRFRDGKCQHGRFRACYMGATLAPLDVGSEIRGACYMRATLAPLDVGSEVVNGDKYLKSMELSLKFWFRKQ